MSASRRPAAEDALLLTVVQLVAREGLHARGIELAHVSRAIDGFVNELPSVWSLANAYAKTRSLRCMQFVAPKALQPSYRTWVVNNVVEMTLRHGDVEALKWVAERYAPESSLTKAAVVAAAEGRLDVLQWLYQRHYSRVHWGGAEWCEAVRAGHKHVVEWLDCHVKPHVEAAPRLMLDAARAGDLQLVQSLHKNYELPVVNALVEAQKSCQWGVAMWILMSGEVEDPHVDMDLVAADGDVDFLRWLHRWLQQHRTEGCDPTALSRAVAGGHLDVAMFLRRERGLACSFRRDEILLRGLRLEMVQWLVTTCREELEQGVQLQVARPDWHFNDRMRDQDMQIVSQDDSNVVWKWSPRR
ncbi:Ankyrin repeat and SAM domain-containing protein 3 [Phytophthora pseudosyringae]|uniref:Ankyrin repeat and SAM domain-containing protein 3 n=1 Tax=Phytophthora pseudosyringae TaxID=221518 RepID=A0A8T1VL61_9STRA|nr:Ankyrin repeat and SAM domain-containing protein 3 [Phytophthora pseudosyringae]